MAKKRKFTLQDKLAILKEASTKGVKETLAKYDVYPATCSLPQKSDNLKVEKRITLSCYEKIKIQRNADR